MNVVKKEQQLSTSFRFQSIQIWSRREKPFPNKNPKINPFVIKSLLESNCKRFRQSAIREHFNLKPETQLKKLIPITEGTIPINIMKQKRSCNQFPSFMSEPYLSTRSETCMHLKKTKVSFKSSQARNTCEARAGPPTSRCINRLQ